MQEPLAAVVTVVMGGSGGTGGGGGGLARGKRGTYRRLENVYPICVWSVIAVGNGLAGLSAAHIGSLNPICQWPD